MKNKHTRRGFTQINKVILNLIQDLQRSLLPFLNGMRGRFQIKFGMTPLFNNGAFTLIELLVVVLIIGILAAVAVPQYQKAVEKSRATQALSLLKSVHQAIKAYQLANGVYPASFEELGIDIPWTGNTKGLLVEGPVRSNNDWSLQIYNFTGGTNIGVFMTRLSGKYKGGQFWIFEKSSMSLIPRNTILCAEQLIGSYQIPTEGMFCKQLFGGTKLAEGSTNRLYSFM